jgi:26S proteasome regulatory subunit N1
MHSQSEEDLQLKTELETLTAQVKVCHAFSLFITLFPADQITQTDSARPALTRMRDLIRTATSSMTSVPKPLKFLREHYPQLVQNFEDNTLKPDDQVGRGISLSSSQSTFQSAASEFWPMSSLCWP